MNVQTEIRGHKQQIIIPAQKVPNCLGFQGEYAPSSEERNKAEHISWSQIVYTANHKIQADINKPFKAEMHGISASIVNFRN